MSLMLIAGTERRRLGCQDYWLSHVLIADVG